MEETLRQLRAEAEAGLASVSSLAEADLEEFRVKYLGRKGLLANAMKQLGQATPEERPRLGQLANTVKQELEGLFQAKKEALEAGAGTVRQQLDLSLPGRYLPFGKLHPSPR